MSESYLPHIGALLAQRALLKEQLDIADGFLGDAKRRHLEIKGAYEKVDEMLRQYALAQFTEHPEYDEEGVQIKKINDHISMRRREIVIVREEETFNAALDASAADLLDIADREKAVCLLLEHVSDDILRTVLQCNTKEAALRFENDDRKIIEAEVVVEYSAVVDKNLSTLLMYNK